MMNKNLEFVIPFTRWQIKVSFSFGFSKTKLPYQYTKAEEKWVADNLLNWGNKGMPFCVSIAEWQEHNHK